MMNAYPIRDPSKIIYPMGLDRLYYIDPHRARKVTPFQWKVYGLVQKVSQILLHHRIQHSHVSSRYWFPA